MKLQALGIDLAKNVFHLVGLDSSGQVVIRKRCSRRQILLFTVNVQVGVIGMEACSGAHFLGRALREQGHEVRLMPAQYVKPYVSIPPVKSLPESGLYPAKYLSVPFQGINFGACDLPPSGCGDRLRRATCG